MNIHIIYLAAGFSRRFGDNKLLHEINGTPMYLHMLEKLLQIAEETENVHPPVVVTQYQSIYDYLIQRNIQVVINPHSEQGITSSIQLGIQNISWNPEDACMFCVADQPYMKKDTLEEFLLAFSKSQKGIGCLTGENGPGNPNIFKYQYRNALLSLTGDRGGKQIIKNNLEDTFLHQVKNEVELEDIDKNDKKAGEQ